MPPCQEPRSDFVCPVTMSTWQYAVYLQQKHWSFSESDSYQARSSLQGFHGHGKQKYIRVMVFSRPGKVNDELTFSCYSLL